MAKSKSRTYTNLTYRQLQAHNRESRSHLRKEDQVWLKTNGYKNLGWENAIVLYEKIADFKSQYDLEDDSLEDLFLKADRIGNKYQTPEEIAAFQAELATEVNAIADIIDEQFPDTEPEIIDYGTQPRKPQRQNAKRSISTRQ
jgi:predicted Rossmann fold nucleotide-binding protein DprA/Smf involved in DNA uptake